MGLAGNPTKGEIPRWETATFTTHDGKQRVDVWFNCETGLTEIIECKRDDLDDSWGSPTSWTAVV